MSQFPARASGVYGPRELKAMGRAYRTILQEMCETGALAQIASSAMSARELRRLAARQVIMACALGASSQADIVSTVLARFAGPQVGVS